MIVNHSDNINRKKKKKTKEKEKEKEDDEQAMLEDLIQRITKR